MVIITVLYTLSAGYVHLNFPVDSHVIPSGHSLPAETYLGQKRIDIHSAWFRCENGLCCSSTLDIPDELLLSPGVGQPCLKHHPGISGSFCGTQRSDEAEK